MKEFISGPDGKGSYQIESKNIPVGKQEVPLFIPVPRYGAGGVPTAVPERMAAANAAQRPGMIKAPLVIPERVPVGNDLLPPAQKVPSCRPGKKGKVSEAKCVTEKMELPGLKCITGSTLYHTETKVLETCGGRFVKAGYGVTIDYEDCDGKEKSKTVEGSVLFFKLSAEFIRGNFIVWLPNPVEIELCECEAKVRFAALLEAEKNHK